MTITRTTAADSPNPNIDFPHGNSPAVQSPGQQPIDADERYFAALRNLSARAVTAKAAMLDAHLAATLHARTAALVDLHHLLRGMAAIINDALGSMNEPREPR
jgi:hypothetical protein